MGVAQRFEVGGVVASWSCGSESVVVVDVDGWLVAAGLFAGGVVGEVAGAGLLPAVVVPACSSTWSSSVAVLSGGVAAVGAA